MKIKKGLVKGHYSINDTTTLTSYCLENHEEVKGISECRHICRKTAVITKEATPGNCLLQHIIFQY